MFGAGRVRTVVPTGNSTGVNLATGNVERGLFCITSSGIRNIENHARNGS